MEVESIEKPKIYFSGKVYCREAKTYLKNIQGADTEKKLIDVEIAFKQDMTLSCSDLGSLCRAAEDRRYSLRNNEETLKLKQILFFRTKAEMLPTCHYDAAKADRAVTFIENLRHTKGKWAGKRFWLLPWQEQIIRDVFGIVDEKGNRQFRTAYG